MPLTIYPYLIDPIWVFDDERAGLKEEAFVCGASEMITRAVEHKKIPNAAAGFTLSFSDEPLPETDVELDWLRADENPLMAGNWYRGLVAGVVMECWLCPALLLYFSTAPRKLYVHAAPLPPGIDPVWQVSPNDPRPRRFVGPEQA
jgi:hypothetical protein